MRFENNPANIKRVRGWIFDVYPSASGQVTVWIITEKGRRLRFIDEFKPQIYISGNEETLLRLEERFFSDRSVTSSRFVYKYADPTDTRKSKVLEVILEDCRKIPFLKRTVLEIGRYVNLRVHNCDLQGSEAYLFCRGVFPLAFTEIDIREHALRYRLLDSVESVDYSIPPLRIMNVDVKFENSRSRACTKNRWIATDFHDPLGKIALSQGDEEIVVGSGDEEQKLLELLKVMGERDPDILVTRGGDAYIFPYLARRALENGILDRFILSRESIPLVAKRKRGRIFFSYGKTYYRAPMRRLYGRVHIDVNSFTLGDCGIEGLIEIARTCRVPLHRASRSSIGSSMSSLQYYQAMRDDFLIPRNKGIPEAFKSAYELLIGDRGGFIYEPQIGLHSQVGEVDFSSMYPSLMVRNNISAETVLCNCCTNSTSRVPLLNYHICEKRVGIVPTVLKTAITKRQQYKRLRDEAGDAGLREAYEKRQAALKWILVTCFGYLGYRNAKFGTVDGHIGVCAFARRAFLRAARIAEEKGFRIVHGIVDSLWLSRKDATAQEYQNLCTEIGEEVGVPLSFEGCYKWIAFLPSKIHPNVAVLNRYFGVKEDGSIKVKGIEARRRDTPKFIHDAQMEMIRVLAGASDSKEFESKIPEALDVVKEYRKKLIAGDTSIWDLIVTKRLSKNLGEYRQKISQAIAGEQLVKKGIEVSAGERIGFLFTSAQNKRHERRVRAEELIEDGVNPDVKKYLLLLYSAASTILSPYGYSAQDVSDYIRGYKRIELTPYLGK